MAGPKRPGQWHRERSLSLCTSWLEPGLIFTYWSRVLLWGRGKKWLPPWEGSTWPRKGAGGTVHTGTPAGGALRSQPQDCQPASALTGVFPASRFSSKDWLNPVAIMVTWTSPSY